MVARGQRDEQPRQSTRLPSRARSKPRRQLGSGDLLVKQPRAIEAMVRVADKYRHKAQQLRGGIKRNTNEVLGDRSIPGRGAANASPRARERPPQPRPSAAAFVTRLVSWP